MMSLICQVLLFKWVCCSGSKEGVIQVARGITVEGTILSEYLKKKAEADEAGVILDHVEEVIVHHRKSIPARIRSQQLEDRTTTQRGSPRVSKRVRYLSREEIEREYGSMEEKKETNKMKLLLSALKTHGQATSAEAAKATGYTLRTAGTTLWRLSRVWPSEFTVDKTERPQVYRISSILRRKTVAELYQEYRSYCRSRYKSVKKKKPSSTEEEAVEAESKVELEGDLNLSDEVFVALAKAAADQLKPEINRLLQPRETETSKDLNLNVNVTFTFKLGG